MKRLVLFWLTSLAFVSMATFALAQFRFPKPQILSGNDIGFRVEGTDVNGQPFGQFMVRWNGQWRPVGVDFRTLPVSPTN